MGETKKILIPKESPMHLTKFIIVVTLLFLIAGFGCSPDRSVDVRDNIRTSLEQAGINDVTIDQDRNTGVITLGGQVTSEEERTHAESVARSFAGDMVISNQIAVRPAGFESEARDIDSNLDDGIENNFRAALIASGIENDVRYEATNGVLTLRGDVRTQADRQQLEKLAASIPNVRQVVNEIQLKAQKATTTQ
jgi:hyperosmotically inducible periplasmic protein